MKASEVFTPGKLPEITYIDDHLVKHAQVLLDSLDASMAVTLSGPSKSGKTVFIEKNIGADRLIPVSGAGISSADELWGRVFAVIGTPMPAKVTKTSGFQGTAGGKVSGKIPLLVSGEVNTAGTWNDSTASQTDAALDYLALLVKEVANTGLVVFIDDFHYINLEAREEISNQIKDAAGKGVLFVLAAVPYHADDAVRANADLRGRAVKLDFNYWNKDELLKIATIGFNALNIGMPFAFIQGLADEAAGSPQLMQALCLNSCYELGFRERQAQVVTPTADVALLSRVCIRTAQTTDYTSIVNLMKDGPKTRGTERNSHLLKSGEVCDVYPLIVKAIALAPPELTIRYPNLQQRISTLCAKETPSGSSVTGACGHMCAIANASEGRNILEWDASHDVLDILDPYLLFFIRWDGN
ncbi:hypothetical protein OSS47_00365 [Pseudomonas citronellolis]|uniref:hypothetical protein n=1 Tax=Pseudomonas citronellolis TaxID=53408 RepID=UPI00226D9371|nr:hypothetical protein [Pseudomonas citronellolis]WAB92469.1 hypothetical protein OSS47_00365 [Pseudomonas citronellolis]